MQVEEDVGAESATRPSGQRQIQNEKRVAEIIAASLHVFAEGGRAGFSMRKVAAVAGVRLNTVQHHFGDLRALLLAMIRAELGKYVVRYQAVAHDEQLPARDRLEAVLDDAFAAIREPEVCAFFFETWALAQDDSAVGELVTKIYTDYCDTYALLARGIEPSLSGSEAAVIGRMIGSMADGFLVVSRFGMPESPPFSAVAVRVKAACLSLFGAAGRTTNEASNVATPPKGVRRARS